jgi:dGTPase
MALLHRQQLEERELGYLAGYAAHNYASRGRQYPEAQHPYRLDFQRDRDRIIHTTAFRRLEYKTQVFVYSEGDHYRNRLTHSLEVAQIGRTLARALGANEDLIEAICLVHDLGHPPFGHVGESALNHLMEGYGGFDHQRQAFRIVTALEHRYPYFPGLNLTYEVLEGIVKHDTAYDTANADAYHPEERGTLECQLSNLADEIAYNTSDLDDGLRSGILDPAEMTEVPAIKKVIAALHFGKMDLRHDQDRRTFIHGLLDAFATDVLETTAATIAQHGIATLAELRAMPFNVAAFSEEMAVSQRILRRFLYQQFYFHYRVVRMAGKAERTLNELFAAYIGDPRQLPTEVQRRLGPEQEDLHRVVCDYLSGMTDRYAIQEYYRLFDLETRA